MVENLQVQIQHLRAENVNLKDMAGEPLPLRQEPGPTTPAGAVDMDGVAEGTRDGKRDQPVLEMPGQKGRKEKVAGNGSGGGPKSVRGYTIWLLHGLYTCSSSGL